jgi:hypothetical protein
MSAVNGRPRPNFFIVGAMKAGTSSMHHYLGQHPQVFMSARKEPRYTGFVPDLDSGSDVDGEWFTRSLDDYLANFAAAGDAPVVGESSHVYLHSEEAARLIHDFAPDARILIILRDPIDMIQARHQQSVWANREDITDFAAALAAEEDRRAGRRLPGRPVYVKGLQYRQACVMTPQVRRYFDTFGAPRVKVILLDDVAASPAATYRDVLEFLGVGPTYVPPDMGVVNPSKTARNLNVRRAFQRRRHIRDRIKQVLPEPVRRVLALPLRLRELNRRRAPRPPLSPRLEAELVDHFAPDVVALGQLIGIDLTARWPRFAGAGSLGRTAAGQAAESETQTPVGAA